MKYSIFLLMPIVYILWAIVYGFNPRLWTPEQKAVFLLFELVVVAISFVLIIPKQKDIE